MFTQSHERKHASFLMQFMYSIFITMAFFDLSATAWDSRCASRVYPQRRSFHMINPSTIWSDYQIALEDAPLLTKSITASVLFTGADICAQLFAKKEPEEVVNVDFDRASRFFALGFFAQAPWNHFFYQYLDRVLPPTEDVFTTTTLVKLIIDQGIQAPLFTVVIFAFLGLLEGKSLLDVQETLNNKYGSTMVANWKLWIPASFLNLAFCPPPYRVLFTNVVFFCWSIFLSIVVNSDSQKSDEQKIK